MKWLQRYDNGEAREVTGRTYGRGIFGVCRTEGDSWQVDHLPTGYRIRKGLSREAAVELAKELSQDMEVRRLWRVVMFPVTDEKIAHRLKDSYRAAAKKVGIPIEETR